MDLGGGPREQGKFGWGSVKLRDSCAMSYHACACFSGSVHLARFHTLPVLLHLLLVFAHYRPARLVMSLIEARYVTVRQRVCRVSLAHQSF